MKYFENNISFSEIEHHTLNTLTLIYSFKKYLPSTFYKLQLTLGLLKVYRKKYINNYYTG